MYLSTEKYYTEHIEDTCVESEDLTWDEMNFWQKHLRYGGLLSLNGIVLLHLSSDRCDRIRPLFRSLTLLLTISAAPLLITASLFRIFNGPACGSETSAVFVLTVILLSELIHEAGHLIASIGYGYYDSEGVELGILFASVLPIGMYVENSGEYIKDPSKKNKVTFLIEGCAVNLLTASICFMLASFTDSSGLSCISNINFILAITNLLPWYCTDGDKIIAVLMGLGEMTFVELVFKSLRSGECRAKMRASLEGIVVGSIFLIVAASQVVFVISLLLSPLWIDELIREDDSILSKLILRIMIKYDLW